MFVFPVKHVFPILSEEMHHLSTVVNNIYVTVLLGSVDKCDFLYHYQLH